MGKVSKLLDISDSVRKARAKQLGYDTDEVLYHGSKQDVEGLKPRFNDQMVFLSRDPQFASQWPIGTGGIRDRTVGESGRPFLDAEMAAEERRINAALEADPTYMEDVNAGNFERWDALTRGIVTCTARLTR